MKSQITLTEINSSYTGGQYTCDSIDAYSNREYSIMLDGEKVGGLSISKHIEFGEFTMGLRFDKKMPGYLESDMGKMVWKTAIITATNFAQTQYDKFIN